MNTGVELPDFKLGLDLHGGVELDYKIDFADLQKRGTPYVERDVSEGLKSIVEKRVNSLGTAEPTITTASYGGESHIIVQIPTQSFAGENLSEAELKAKNNEYIAKAKDTIGKVVRLEFKEKKETVTDADRAARKTIADEAHKELATTTDFAAIAKKFAQNNENVAFLTGSEVKESLPAELAFTGFTTLTKTGLTDVLSGEKAGAYTLGADGKLTKNPGEKAFVIANITDIKTVTQERDVTGTGATGSGVTKKEKYETKQITYQALYISERPSEWMPAKTADGKALDEKYISRASVGFTQGYTPQIDLLFNEDGKKIFAELTKRMIGKQLAIYVGGEQLTAPTVQAVITDGHAVITGQYTAEEAKKLANDINTGIVPAPIYLTSERAIDAKIGADALEVIIYAGVIGLLAIIIFLVVFYRVSGLLAGVALVIYGILLLAIIKLTGIVLTLAGIAGIILSIGLAIDANILIFERTKEALRDGADTTKATVVGFAKSWTAIWDSHITSLTSAVILYIFGVSLIKGFGLALGLGIALSLFTAMWVSRVLILSVGSKFNGRENAFVGFKK
ncbi:MAG: protein translocase subunit SecD [Patescibacteria group bacterium]